MLQARLKELRKAAGETQDETASACGISRVTLGRYETGTRSPEKEPLMKLAQHFGVSMEYLLGVEDITSASMADQPEVQQKTAQPIGYADFVELYNGLTTDEKKMLLMMVRSRVDASKK